MRKILITLIIAGMSVLCLFHGCTKVLEENAIREPVADVYYNTPAGYKELINACYTYTRTAVQFSVWALFEYGTDLWTNGSDGAQSEFNTYLPHCPRDTLHYTAFGRECIRELEFAIQQFLVVLMAFQE